MQRSDDEQKTFQVASNLSRNVAGKVEGRSTFLATRNVTIAAAKWDVTGECFLATCNATFITLQVARKISSCNMTFRVRMLLNNLGAAQ